MKAIKSLLFIVIPVLILSCGNGSNDYDASGVFEATEILISAEANGKIMAFNLMEGQSVEQGEIVGYIDTTQLVLKKKEISARMNTVNSRRLNIPKQIASIRQQIETQQKELARFENLLKANAANRKQVDDIKAGIQLLEKELAAHTETLQNSNNSVTEESSALDVQIAQMEDQIEKSVITSPINGTILSKYAEPGELAMQGKALFKVADISNMYLRAYITADQLTQLKLGQAVKVYADFGEKEMREYPGTITWISDKSEFTPKTIQTRNERANLVYALKVTVKNDGYIKKGMYGELKIN